MDGISGTAIASMVINAGFAALVAWYLLSKAIPDMQKQHSASLAEQRKEYALSLSEQRKDLTGMVDRDRISMEKILSIVAGNDTQILRTISEKLDETTEQSTQANTRLTNLERAMSEFRSVFDMRLPPRKTTREVT